MTTSTESKPLYIGATTCDFVPAFPATLPGESLALVRACFDADADELTPWLMLADELAAHADPRERWVRAGVQMWQACGTLKVGADMWDYGTCKAVLKPVCESSVGWRVAGLWGCLVAWHAPAGDGSGRVMGRTWVDERVRVVQRSLWCWSLGLLDENPLDVLAWQQAYAAWQQADAAWQQAYAAGQQADAAGRQAYAAWRQAYAAWQQAYAAGQQAYAAWQQAYAAGQQADVWQFARACWEKVCVPRLKTLAGDAT